MLAFDEGCIRSDIWMIKHEKWEKTHNLGTFRRLLPVQLKLYRYNFVTGHFLPSSTGTIEVVPVQYRYWSFLAKFYRYNLGFYRYNCYSVPNFNQFS